MSDPQDPADPASKPEPSPAPNPAPAPTPAAAPAAKKARRNPWLIVGAVIVAVAVLAAIGYFAGLGPMSRLSTTRDIDPPDKLAGLNRITDSQTRNQLQLDKTRENLMRINDGKEATVEAYGDPAGDRLFVVIALRGRVDIDQYVKDAGAKPEQVKKLGKSTCVASADDVPTQCYRGSNTLTVIVQVANENVGADAVAPVAAEAFKQMK